MTLLTSLTTEELIARINADTPTEREIILLDRLQSALDEVDELYELMAGALAHWPAAQQKLGGPDADTRVEGQG